MREILGGARHCPQLLYRKKLYFFREAVLIQKCLQDKYSPPTKLSACFSQLVGFLRDPLVLMWREFTLLFYLEVIIMELVILVVFVVAVVAYYGGMKVLEQIFTMATDEVSHQSDVHYASIAKRTADLGAEIDDETAKKAKEVRARIAKLRAAAK